MMKLFHVSGLVPETQLYDVLTTLTDRIYNLEVRPAKTPTDLNKATGTAAKATPGQQPKKSNKPRDMQSASKAAKAIVAEAQLMLPGDISLRQLRKAHIKAGNPVNSLYRTLRYAVSRGLMVKIKSGVYKVNSDVPDQRDEMEAAA
jgi:hypothetical protein